MAMDVKSIAIPAGSINAQGERIRLRCYWIGGAGATITGTMKFNGVTVCTNNDMGVSDIKVLEAWLHYVDNTHANIISVPDGVVDQAASAVNVAGFSWSSAQNLVISQDAVTGKHVTVYLLVADIFPK